MGEIVRTSRVMSFNMECPKCKRGFMNFIGMNVITQDGQERFLHVCGSCGHQEAYEKRYPSNTLLGECAEVHEQ